MRFSIVNIFFFIALFVSCEKDAENNQQKVDPVCNIIKPADGAEIIQGEQVTIVAEATDENNNLSQVQFYLNNEMLKTVTRFPYSFTWSTEELDPGEKEIKAIAVDDEGGTDEDVITIHILDRIAERIIIDADGNLYKTVIIGSQVWMAENLKTTTLNDSTSISVITENKTWSEQTEPALSWYGKQPDTYGKPFGALYNWYAVNTGRLCPEGWRVPKDEDWSILVSFLGGAEVAGGKLKEQGGERWVEPNMGATNESGFTAVGGGYRYHDGTFHYLGGYGIWWSSTVSDDSGAWSRLLENNSSEIRRYNYEKTIGLSVRCMRLN